MPLYLLDAGIGKRRTCHVLSVYHVDDVIVVPGAAHVSDDGVHDHHRLWVDVQICQQEGRAKRRLLVDLLTCCTAIFVVSSIVGKGALFLYFTAPE